MLKFKHDEQREQWDSGNLPLRLGALVYVILGWMLANYGIGIVITSIWRPKTTDSGIHAQWRGVDIRTSDWPDGAVDRLVEWLNKAFMYDPTRGLSTAIHHDVGQGIHLHIQVSAASGHYWRHA